MEGELMLHDDGILLLLPRRCNLLAARFISLLHLLLIQLSLLLLSFQTFSSVPRGRRHLPFPIGDGTKATQP
jgi:hypothetical protein